MRMPVNGWLLVLCMLLLVWAPFDTAFSAARALEALPLRGPGLAVILMAQLIAVAVGIAAGLALLGRRPGAVAMANVALVTAAAVDVITYATPYYPNNRPPGDSTLILLGSLAYYAIWMLYLWRSKRVHDTFR
jgi:hypothetical protein